MKLIRCAFARRVSSTVIAIHLSLSAAHASLHWDPDSNPINNDLGIGTGLGGAGIWDLTNPRWYDGTTHVAWDNNIPSEAVFWGTAGTVTVETPMTADTLTFKSANYVLQGEPITLSGNGLIHCTGNQTINNTISGGDLVKDGTGRLTLNGTNDYFGRTLIYRGSVSITNDFGLGTVGASADSIVLSNATLRVTGPSFTLNSGRGITLDGDGGTIETSGNSGTTLTYAGNISGEGKRLTKTGSRSYRATGNSTFSGGLTVAGGTYRFANEVFTLSGGNPGQLGAYPGTVVSNYIILSGGGILRSDRTGAGSTFVGANRGIFIGSTGGAINTSSANVGDSTLYAGLISGTGVLTKTGPNEFRYQGANLPNTTFSKLIVSQGLFRLGFSASTQDERGFGAVPAQFTQDAITLNGGAIGTSFTVTLHTNRGITLGANGGQFVTAGAPMTIPTPIAGNGKLKRIIWGTSSGGTLTLSGQNTFTGGVLISNSTTTVTATGKLCGPTAPVEIHGGTLNLNNTEQTIGGLEGTGGTVNLGTGHTLTINPPTNMTFSGLVAGSGAVTKTGAGAWIVNRANTYSGGTTISGGSVLANDLTGASLGTGNVTLQGTGTLGGTGIVNNAVAGDGNVAPGASVGTLTLQGGLDLSSGGSYVWELGALSDDATGNPGSDFDQLDISGGNLVLGGNSKLVIAFTAPALAPDFAESFWQTSHKWTILRLTGGFNPSETGFSSIVNGAPYAGTFSTAVEPNGDISVTYTPAGPTAPIIISHPENQVALQGATATFTVNATGTAPLSYNWYRGAAFMGSGSSLVLNNVQPADEGTYHVVVSNPVDETTSSGATLTIAVPPQINTQPESQSVSLGGSATFSVEATGGALSYQWKFNGTNIVDATASSYTVTDAEFSDAGNYSVLVSNIANSVLSANAALTVTGGPVVNITVVGETVTLSWTAIAGGVYRVEYKADLSDNNWTTLGSDVTATGAIASTTDATTPNGRFYRVLLLAP